jgi:hypothetical protein
VKAVPFRVFALSCFRSFIVGNPSEAPGRLEEV